LKNDPRDYSWEQAATALSGLQSLRLGLSGVQVVALALPKLTSLDLNSCSHLRVLELRCPLLLLLQLQACRALGWRQQLPLLVGGCPDLESLDLQHALPRGAAAEVGAEEGAMVVEEVEMDALQRMGASLKQLLLCQPDCGVCTNSRLL
jgi:hypothetical protein